MCKSYNKLIQNSGNRKKKYRVSELGTHSTVDWWIYWLNPSAYILGLLASLLAIPPTYVAKNIKMMSRYRMKRILSMAWDSKFQSVFGLLLGFGWEVEFCFVSESVVELVLVLVTSLQNASTSIEYPGIPGGIFNTNKVWN